MAAAAISIAVRRNHDSNEDEESPTLLPGRIVKEEDQDIIERMLGSPSVSEGGESLASIGAISRQQPGVFRGGAPVLGSFRSLGSMDSTRDPLLPENVESFEEESEELCKILYEQVTFKKGGSVRRSGFQKESEAQAANQSRSNLDPMNPPQLETLHSDLQWKMQQVNKSCSPHPSPPAPSAAPPPHEPLFLLDPHGVCYQTFHSSTILLSILVSIVNPFNVAYLDCGPAFTTVNCLLYATDVVFLVDVILTFFTAVFIRGRWETDPLGLAWNYVTGYLFYDLVETIPWDLLLKILFAPSPHAAVALSCFGFFRLLRLKRLMKCFWDIGVDLHYDYFTTSVVKFSALIVYDAHWAACGFYLIARLYHFDGDTWVGRCEPDLPTYGPFHAYVASIYWAMTTISTAGYGDFSAFTIPERVWTSTFMLINLGLTAYVLGNMTVLLTKADAQTATYRDRLASMNRYMVAHKVPEDIQGQLKAHLKLHFETSEVRDDILRQCPASIRMRIQKHVFSKWVNMPYLFQGTSQVFRDQLTCRMHVEFFVANTSIITAGDTVNEMYILASQNEESQVVAMASDGGSGEVWFGYDHGDMIGEFGFICEITQVWTVRTVAPCRLLVLEREEYETLARNHQEDARIVLRNLQERAKAVESAGRKYVQNHPVASLTKFLHQQLQSYMRKLDQETMMNLCYAAKQGDLVEVCRLTAGDFDLSQTDYDRRTPLHLAASYGHDAVIQFLIDRGAQVNPKDCFWRTPLQEAVSAAHWSAAEILRSQGGKLGLRNEGTHMCRLAHQGHADEIEHLLQYGANPNAADYDMRTGLHIAAAEGHLGVVHALVNADANINCLDRWQNTPLDEAIRSNHPEVIEVLRAHGGRTSRALI